MIKCFYLFAPNTKCALEVALSGKKQEPFFEDVHEKCGTHAQVVSHTLAWEQQE